MPRRLLDSDPQRERRRQMLIIERIERRYLRRYTSEIARASRKILEGWEVMGTITEDAEHGRRIEAIMRQNWRSSIESMAGRIREQMKSGNHPVVTKSEAQDAFALYEQEYLSAYGAQKVQQVTQTTKAQISAMIERGRANGDSIPDIAKAVRGRIPALSGVRANVIARTETHSAANFAATSQAKDTGLDLQKEWIAASDERTRDSHIDADGQVVGMDAAFDVNGESLAYPGDPAGSAGNIINCRCAVGYVVTD